MGEQTGQQVFDRPTELRMRVVEQLVPRLDRVPFAGHAEVPAAPIFRLGRVVRVEIDALPVAAPKACSRF